MAKAKNEQYTAEEWYADALEGAADESAVGGVIGQMRV